VFLLIVLSQINCLLEYHVSPDHKSQTRISLPSNISRAFAKLRKATISFFMSVHPSVRMEHLGFHWTDFHEFFLFGYFFENLSRKFKFHYNLTKITGTLHEDQYTFLIISR